MKKDNAKKIENKPVGAVLVVGGGITGMTATLDLAESGFKVYLSDTTPGIGGKMVQLDKTFPTGDCAMCTIAPRLVECGRHRNIELLPATDVDTVTGEPGNFCVTLNQKPVYVDLDKCNACGDCEKVCPVEIANSFDYGLGKRKAIYKMYPQAIPNFYTVSKPGVSPCRVACPAGVNAHGYVALIRAGKFQEALDLVRDSIPFPSTCGRICTHPCETECTRREIDESISICALKRFLADWEMNKSPKSEVQSLKSEVNSIQSEIKHTTKKEPVAVIGSGPAGLTCAYHLAKFGYKVTVYESQPVAGGMLRLAIPDFRLPSHTVDREIEYVKSLGVDIRTNVTVGNDVTLSELQRQYKSIFIATGTTKSRLLDVKGENLFGVFSGLDFLFSIKSGKRITLGDKVVVVGGGNTAVDCAMSALRLGVPEVTILYRRTREEMPAHPDELNQAEKEGVRIVYLTAPQEIIGRENKVTGLRCIKMQLTDPDESGRRKPVPVKGSEFILTTDSIIIAVGQYADLSFIPPEFNVRNDIIPVNPDTLETTVPGIFAGGDVATGPDVLINAVAAGRKAAISITRYLKGEKLTAVHISPQNKIDRHRIQLPAHKSKVPRVIMTELKKEERLKSFTEINYTLTEESARAEASRCLDCGICSECFECVKVCVPKAINHQREHTNKELNVGAIILTPGFTPFNPEIKEELGYRRYKDVVTSVEYERILSASGPFGGEIKRLSDGKKPDKIAFIHCVGSRDRTVNREYCSAVCCMYTVKEAMVTKEHLPHAEIKVFYIDVRAFGKGYEAYFTRAKTEYGIKYQRSTISKISENPQTKKLKLKYIDTDSTPVNASVITEEFDLVVLAVGMEIAPDVVVLSRKLGINLNQYNYGFSTATTPTESSKPGVYVAGTFTGPKDIPESVVQGLSAASDAGNILYQGRNTLTEKKEFPPEKDVSKDQERIGVFVCHCGKNIASVIDVATIARQVKELPGVVHSETNLFTCAPDGLDNIVKAVHTHHLNRVVIASCSPRTHEILFQENLRTCGLNPYLVTMANIRDQCSWVHSRDLEKATHKAKKLVQMAVGKARYLEPLPTQTIPITNRGLVIGGGLTGMQTALSLARQGSEVYLIEKTATLGGNLRDLYYTLEIDDIQQYLTQLISEIKNNDKITVFTSTEVKEVTGFIGNFKTKIKSNYVISNGIDNVQELEHGIIIVATGAEEYKPKEFLYGKHNRVITQRELEKMIVSGGRWTSDIGLRTVVMIQCVGSRNDEHPYCSRICCTEAVKNAIKIKVQEPQSNVYVLHRDIRTYGMKEVYYQKARELGVLFIRFPDEIPLLVFEEQGMLKVKVTDQSLNQELILDTDWLVLSTGIVPYTTTSELASLLKVPVNEDGFFLEAHIKLRPVDFATRGIFLAGLAHSPQFIDENISQAKGAVSRAMTVLSKPELEISGIVAQVSTDKCAACLTCVRVCPYHVPVINAEGVAEISLAQCQGCGICAAACPGKAIQLRHFQDKQIIAECTSLFI